jgi:dTDP-4-amino-4,6-dideoxygalactose transaminase
VLTAKLARLDAWNDARRSIVARYRAAFASGPARLITEAAGAQGVFHLAVIRVPAREMVQQQLTAAGITTAIHYPIPCHLQDPYRRYATGPLPVAEATADQVLSLPIFPHMSDEQVVAVCDEVHDAVDHAPASKQADIA